MKLSQILLRENNNIDMVRLAAASAVIIGHSFAISPQPPLVDVVSKYLQFDYSGSLAVKLFFFLSGLVVTNSWLRNPSLSTFVVNRIFRLLPALILCVVFTVLVVGPLTTVLPLRTYFGAPETWRYFFGCISVFQLEWYLPGVFVTNPLSAVNGSLWTLPLEAVCYFALALAGALGILGGRLGTFIPISLLAVSAIWPTSVPMFGALGEATYLPFCFTLGALFAVYQDDLDMNLSLGAGLVLAAYMFKSSPAFQAVFYVALFYGALTLSALPMMVRLRPPMDISYGVYLYGFPVQQALKHWFPTLSIYGHQVSALLIAGLLGAVSWILIERRSIRFGKRLSGAISHNFDTLGAVLTNALKG